MLKFARNLIHSIKVKALITAYDGMLLSTKDVDSLDTIKLLLRFLKPERFKEIEYRYRNKTLNTLDKNVVWEITTLKQINNALENDESVSPFCRQIENSGSVYPDTFFQNTNHKAIDADTSIELVKEEITTLVEYLAKTPVTPMTRHNHRVLNGQIRPIRKHLMSLIELSLGID